MSRTRLLSLDFQFPPQHSFRLNLASPRDLSFTPLPLGVPPRYLHMVTDASGEGWGIVLPYAHYSGRFGTSLLQAHIVLKVMIYILGFFPLVPNHTAVMVHTDSRVSPGSTQRLLSNRSAGQVVSGGLNSDVSQVRLPATHIPPRRLRCSGGSTVRGCHHFDGVIHQRRRLRNSSPRSRVRTPDSPVLHRT